MVLKDFHYESQKDQELIGHAGAASCTFLPNTVIVKDWVIVDFPGFDDTNGPLISLGMECALKALIEEYKPKVLVLEAITNTEGKYAAAKQLGMRLDRLLANKEDCLLGITKYTKDPHYGQLKKIEEEQKKERSAPTQEESTLEIEIRTLSDLNMPILQSQIKEKKQRLDKLKQDREQQLNQQLPETAEKAASRKRIEDNEKQLLNEIGLTSFIPLANLEDLKTLSSYFQKLDAQKTIHVDSKRALDANDRALLDKRFENQLMKDIRAKTFDENVAEGFENLHESILATSLINTLFSQSNSEIGQFFHLPEIDPNIVRGYDKKIVGDCIRKCILAVIGKFPISDVKQTLNDIKRDMPKEAANADIDEVIKSLSYLKKYILGLLGNLPKNPEDAEQMDKVWTNIQEKHKATKASIEEEFQLPTLADSFWRNMDAARKGAHCRRNSWNDCGRKCWSML